MLSTCFRDNMMISTNTACHMPQKDAFYKSRSWIYINVYCKQQNLNTDWHCDMWAVSWFVCCVYTSHRKWRPQETWIKKDCGGILVKLCTVLEFRLPRTDLVYMLIAFTKPSKPWANSNRCVLKVSERVN